MTRLFNNTTCAIFKLFSVYCCDIVEYMVYPSDLCRVTTTENLGICTPHRSTQDPHGGGPGPGILCDAVGGELDHINHGFRPRQDQANQPEPVRSVQTSRID